MVTAPSAPSDWRTSDVASISVNGQATTHDDAAEFLATTKPGVQTITVLNGPLERTFEFDFCLAEEDDLRLVDQALDKLIANRHLSREAIAAFIMRAGRGETARRYREGLASYLYGVLHREGNQDQEGSADATGAPLYEQRYNSAVSVLGAFDRPPAEAICGLVALHYNQFDVAVRKTNSHRVSDVAARFRSLIEGSPVVTSSLLDRTHGSLDEALSDSVQQRDRADCLADQVEALIDRVTELEALETERLRAATANRPRRGGVAEFLPTAFTRLDFILDAVDVIANLESPSSAMRALADIDSGQVVGNDLEGMPGWFEVPRLATGIAGSQRLGRIYYKPNGGRVLVSVHIKQDEKQQKRHIDRLRSF
jgi:hypothetical protein